MARLTADDEGAWTKLFWDQVNKFGPFTPGLAGRCWLWTGRVLNSGYGGTKAWRWGNGPQEQLVHRVSWIIHHGGIPIPAGLEILHGCDRKLCVNPVHLTPGTHSDNMLDMSRKGRRKWDNAGEKNPRALLTEETVRAIRKRYVPRHPIHGAAAIARELKVSHSAVKLLIQGRHWKTV